MLFCDTHIHLLAPEWETSVRARISAARRCGIDLLLQPGVRAADWKSLIELADESPPVFAAPGLHPMVADCWNPQLAERLEVLALNEQVLAIGEIGLDALLAVDPGVQERTFRGQLEIALTAELPVLIHCRKKTAAVLTILRASGIDRTGGIWHGFSGSLETAQQIIDLGLVLGIGPVLLRDNARKLPEVVKAVPAEVLVLETDAPDMAAGPRVLIDVANRLAELRGWTLEETARITTANARRILQRQD